MKPLLLREHCGSCPASVCVAYLLFSGSHVTLVCFSSRWAVLIWSISLLVWRPCWPLEPQMGQKCSGPCRGLVWTRETSLWSINQERKRRKEGENGEGMWKWRCVVTGGDFADVALSTWNGVKARPFDYFSLTKINGTCFEKWLIKRDVVINTNNIQNTSSSPSMSLHISLFYLPHIPTHYIRTEPGDVCVETQPFHNKDTKTNSCEMYRA